MTGRSLPPGPMAGIAAVAIIAMAAVLALPQSFRGSFSPLMREHDGPPIRWDPCGPIHYVVNLEHAPPSALEDTHEAARRIGEASGLEFVFDGTTEEAPTYERQLLQPERYGDSWAPVLVAWVREGDNRLRLRMPKLGVGVPFPVRNAHGRLVYVSGVIGLNGDYVAPAGFESTTAWGSVVLHEFGHLVGLGHVRARDEVMYPAADFKYPTDWGIGDSVGLFLLGRAPGCQSVPSPRPSTGEWRDVDFPDKPEL